LLINLTERGAERAGAYQGALPEPGPSPESPPPQDPQGQAGREKQEAAGPRLNLKIFYLNSK